MTVRSGQAVYYGNSVILERAQNSGISSSGVTRERIHEDGNPKAVGLVPDIPTVTYDLESYDLSTDVEAILCGIVPSSVVAQQQIDLRNAVPLDIISPWRTQYNGTAISGGMIVPGLFLESASYRFGVRQNAGETFTLRGDAQYIVPGSPYRDTFAKSGSGGGTGPYSLAHTALQYVENGASIFVLALGWLNTDGTFKRLFHGLDYTDTATTFTLTAAAAAAMPAGATLSAVYGSAAAATVSTSPTSSSIVKPPAYRSKDIDVYISDGAATPTMVRWGDVQSVEVAWRATLTADQELGNPHYISQDYDIPDVTGNLVVRPRDVASMLAKVSQATGVPSNQVVGLLADTPLPMEIRVSHPDTGVRVKTIYIDDARITVPPFATRANSIQDVTFPFQSEQGDMAVIKGIR